MSGIEYQRKTNELLEKILEELKLIGTDVREIRDRKPLNLPIEDER